DADDEDEKESSDSKEEEEEHLAPTVPAPVLYNISLWKRALFTTLTSRYEIGESFVAAAARQIRPTL
nr:hypothetical protein [Tanacetum cinerariifolium]